MKIIFKTALLSAIVALFASDIWAQSSYKPTTEAPAASTFSLNLMATVLRTHL